VITVKKSLNNSMLLVDYDQQELILFGKGIGFGTKPGTLCDISHVEKVFIPLQDLKSRHFLSLTDTIPAAFFDLTHDIISQAQTAFSEKLNSVLFFTLAEHLWFAAERLETGQLFMNKLSWEVKRYYPKEFALGEQARQLANARLNVELPEEEAVNIAFHLINATSRDNHASNTEDFYQELLRHRPDAMAVSWAIRDYVQEKYQLALPKDELTWLSIHISRLMEGHA